MMKYKYILAFLFLTNFIFSIVNYYLGLDRPLINFDYLIILVFLFSSHKFIAISLLFASFLVLYIIDLILIIFQVFPFIRLADLVYLGSFVFNGPVLYRILILMAIINFFITFFIIRDCFSHKINLNSKQFFILISFCTILVFLSNVIISFGKDDLINFRKPLFNSQLFFWIKNHQHSFAEAFNNNSSKLALSRFDASTQNLFNQLKDQEKLSNKILVVVNESWGETLISKHQFAILASIYKKQNKLEFLQQGTFGFVGATVAGELRELCQKYPITFNLEEVNASEFTDCLPNQLKKIGYQTVAIHGAKGEMYDRLSWYPKAGFERLNFFEKLQNAGSCRAFSGRCDTKIVSYVKESLLQSQRSFVYWLTLNTHAPYDDILIINDLNCDLLKVEENTETCKNYKLQYQFFSTLSQIIDDPSMRGVEVYVVGDHSPPIFNMGKNLFSFKGSEVPWIHFKIKD